MNKNTLSEGYTYHYGREQCRITHFFSFFEAIIIKIPDSLVKESSTLMYKHTILSY